MKNLFKKIKSNASFIVPWVILGLAVVIFGSGLTYAYFDFVGGSQEESSLKITGTDFDVSLYGDNISVFDVAPIYDEYYDEQAFQYLFEIENNSRRSRACYSIYFNITDISSGLISSDFKWKLVNIDTSAVVSGTFAEASNPEILISSYNDILYNQTDHYKLYIWLSYSGSNQINTMGATFTSNLKITGNSGVCPQEPVLANSSCFSFSAGAIKDYYDYQGNNSANPACPRALIIPSSISGTTVTTIDTSAFYNNQLTAVEIPNTVTTIKGNAFRINNLVDIKIPSSVTSIKYYAFYQNKLKSVTLPSSITVIEDYVFFDNNISKVKIFGNITSIGQFAFAENRISDFDIPSSVISIGKGAFNDNEFSDEDAFIFARTDANSDGIAEINTSRLISYAGADKTNITIPSTVTTIGEKAFQSVGLRDITIPSNVTTLEEWAFFDNNLTQLTIPSSVVNMGLLAFNRNSLPDSTAYIYARTDVNSDNIAEVDTTKTWSYGGAKKQNVTIPSGVVTIGAQTFRDCYMESIIIPANVMSIEDSSFLYNNLKGVCIKGKSSSTDFSYYSPSFEWASGYSDSDIVWNCPY